VAGRLSFALRSNLWCARPIESNSGETRRSLHIRSRDSRGPGPSTGLLFQPKEYGRMTGDLDDLGPSGQRLASSAEKLKYRCPNTTSEGNVGYNTKARLDSQTAPAITKGRRSRVSALCGVPVCEQHSGKSGRRLRGGGSTSKKGFLCNHSGKKAGGGARDWVGVKVPRPLGVARKWSKEKGSSPPTKRSHAAVGDVSVGAKIAKKRERVVRNGEGAEVQLTARHLKHKILASPLSRTMR